MILILACTFAALLLILWIIAITNGNWYHIRKGKHFSSSVIKIRDFKIGNRLKFLARFDKSCLYDTAILSDDINKLYGLIDNGINVHKNSFRFGWRPDKKQEKVEIFAYWYKDKVRGYEYLGSVNVDQTYTFSMSSLRSVYAFTFDGITFCTPRTKNRSIPIHIKLFPYFGGDNVAPHDMKVYIKDIV